MNRYRSALQEIEKAGNTLDTVTMVELVSLGLVDYKSHYGPPVLTPKGMAVITLSDEYDYYYHHSHNGMIPLMVVEVHGKQWIVKNCDDCGTWSCHVSNIYMQPKETT